MNALLIWKGFSAAAIITVSTSAIPLTPALISQVRAQVPLLPGLELQKRNEFDVGTVRLDGYRLFQVAASKVDNKDEKRQNLLPPIDLRVNEIERRLYKVVHSNFDPNTLQVSHKLLDNQPVIYVKDGANLSEQILMTVTALDSQLVVVEATVRAEELSQIIAQALIRAQYERQPQFWQRQSLLAVGAIFTASVLSLGLRHLQRRTKAQRASISKQKSTQSVTDCESPEPSNQPESIVSVKQRMNRQQKLNLNEIQRLLLGAGQIVIWGSALALTLGLFPHTRWLQPLIFSAPLKVLGIAIITYVGVRLLTVFIDRFFCAIEHGEFVESRASQRLALRVSTFSWVLKSISVVVGINVGILVTLLVLGVDIVPLLAAAGVFAVSISLASQHVVRDAINGFFILIEDQYAVGDVIVVGNIGGLVEYMTLRITQVRNDEGRLITIPNGTISVVENLTKEWSRVNFTIDIAYDADLERSLSVIKQVAEQMYHERIWRQRMLELPEVLGVDEIDHAGILIRVWLKVKPLEQWNVAREFRRRLKLTFDREGISVGAPQQSLWFRSSLELTQAKNGSKDGRSSVINSTTNYAPKEGS